jgi:hypothetical protein
MHSVGGKYRILSRKEQENAEKKRQEAKAKRAEKEKEEGPDTQADMEKEEKRKLRAGRIFPQARLSIALSS